MRSMLCCVCLMIFSCAGFSQDYPARPVRMLLGYSPGGGLDILARVVSSKLSESLGRPFVVEYRPGASGGVAAEALVRSAPDGHVLMLAESGTLALPAINLKVTLDPVKQFEPVGGICMLPMVFVVSADFPARTPQELIAVLKASPEKHSYASPGVGTLQHLAFELFKRAAGVDVLHVPFKGGTAAITNVMGGQVSIGVLTAFTVLGQANTGRIRTLAVTSPQRLPSAPNWPALAETIPGFSAAVNVFLVAPAGTPPAVIQRLSGALRAAVAARDVDELFAKQGAIPSPSSPGELSAQIAEEVKRWATVAKDAGIKAE